MHKKREPKQFYTKLGQVHFRLLCDNSAAGGLIGSAGTIVKALETATASKVVVGVSSADNLRLVSVFADHSLSRTIDVDGVEVRVSAAQEALVRVFDRLVEVDAECGGGGGGGSVKCRLVVGPGMVGAVMGKGGVRISKVSRETQAYVKVLPLELPPSGADASDELILITGGSLPVRKALVVISQFIQQKAIEIERGAPESISSRFEDKSMKMGTSNSRVNNTANGTVTEVVFKLICPYRAAGFVIGFKGIKLKSIQDETRASIKFLEPDAGNRERVAVISAFENRASQYSFAQNATVRVFNELFSSEEAQEGNKVTARLLILPHQSDLLSGGEVSILSTIQNDTGATLIIVELDYLPVGANATEKVLQIDGDYPNVQIALFQVTWILRERFFDSSLPKGTLPLLPHKLFNMPSQRDNISAVTDKMNNFRVSRQTNGSRPNMFPHSKFSAGSSLTKRTESSGNSVTAKDGSNFGSDKKSFTVTNTKLELAIREDVFSSVYGENGSNLSRLRQISGATVEVQDPCSGSDGKVIISGTHDQTLVAQSLLQAFLMSA